MRAAGSHTPSRTENRRFWRPVLCQLSYVAAEIDRSSLQVARYPREQLAGSEGVEPSCRGTPASHVQGGRIRPLCQLPWVKWCRELELNQRRPDFRSGALPTELPRQNDGPFGGWMTLRWMPIAHFPVGERQAVEWIFQRRRGEWFVGGTRAGPISVRSPHLRPPLRPRDLGSCKAGQRADQEPAAADRPVSC